MVYTSLPLPVPLQLYNKSLPPARKDYYLIFNYRRLSIAGWKKNSIVWLLKRTVSIASPEKTPKTPFLSLTMRQRTVSLSLYPKSSSKFLRDPVILTFQAYVLLLHCQTTQKMHLAPVLPTSPPLKSTLPAPDRFNGYSIH